MEGKSLVSWRAMRWKLEEEEGRNWESSAVLLRIPLQFHCRTVISGQELEEKDEEGEAEGQEAEGEEEFIPHTTLLINTT